MNLKLAEMMIARAVAAKSSRSAAANKD